MSTVIDQRVVEMRFDNKHFEKNTKTTMSTLDKLKAKLNLSGAAKGLDEINKSANNVNMKGLSGALDSVSSRFSALEVMGVTALANITNSAVNAGLRIGKALTIDPVTTGFREYELKMDSVKTIMASTGESIDTVNKYLEELNAYSDQTIYSFSDMTQNIGKFTNAGVKLEDAVMAIKGISNEAAVSGANANEASRAMYNFAQALSAGYVKLIDWKSIENANMATVEFKQQLLDTAVELGTVTKASDGMYKTLEGNIFNATKGFNEVLQDQWMTSEVLVETLKDYADSTTEIGKKAFAAAQDVTKLSQVFDIAKEVAQSGWAKTWELVFGDLEEAKALFTRLSEFITGIQTKFISFRNNLLEGALSFNPFTALLEKLDAAGITGAMSKINGLSSSLENYQDMVTAIWRGDYNNRGDNPDRFDLLREAGWNPSVLQVLVNKGYQYKITMEDIAAAHETCNVAMEDMTKTLDELTDAQLLEMGLTKDEIDLYRDLEKQSKKTGKSISELINEMSKKDGRTLLIEGFANLGKSLVSIFNSVGEAWTNAFPPMTAMQLYNLIDGFNKLTVVIKGFVDDNADELTRTLKGLFAILDIITTFVGGAFKIAFTVIKGVLGGFGFAVENVLDFTALLGDGLVIIRDAIDEYLWFFDIFGVAAKFITKSIKAFKDWVLSNKLVADSLATLKGYISDFREGLEKLKEDPESLSKAFDKFAKSMGKIGSSIGSWFKGIFGSDIAQNIFEGLINGLKTGGSTIYNFLINIGTQMLEAIKNVLGIESPSKEFYEIGKNSMEGLFNGISNFVKMVYNLVMSIGGKLIDIVQDLDLGSIFTIAIGGGAIYSFIKIASSIAALTSPLEEVGDFIKQFKKTVKSLGKALEFRMLAESMKAMATAVAILAGSVAVLSLLEPGKVWSAVGAITVLMALLGALTYVAGKFGGDKGLEFGKIALTIIGLAIGMKMMAKALKIIGQLGAEGYEQGVKGLVVIILSLISVMSMVAKTGNDFAQAGVAFIALGGALYLMAKVVKILGKLDATALKQGLLAITVFGVLVIGLMAATKLLNDGVFGNVEHIGGAIFKIAAAMLMMAIVAKVAGSMDTSTLGQGIAAMAIFELLIIGLMAATKAIGSGQFANVDKIGGTIFKIGAAMLMMAFVARIAGSMSPGEMAKGVIAITAFGLIVVGLMKATKHISEGQNVTKIGRTLLSLSIAIGIMGVTAALLSMISLGGLAKGIIAVGLLTTMMTSLVKATGQGKQMMGTLIVITTAIGILALALGLLSMIDPTKLATATLAMGTVIGMLALVVAATGMSKKAEITIGVITLCIAALAGVLYGLAQLPMQQTLGSAIALSTLLLAMTAALGLLALIGPVAMAALTGLGALVVTIVAVGAVVAAIGAVFELFPEIEGFLDKGIPILEKIGYAIGSFVGHIIGGLSAGITSGLPQIGKNLSSFMDEVQTFVSGASAIGENNSVINGVKTLAEAILIITGTNLLTSLTSWLTGENSIEGFGTQLVSLGGALKGFIDSLAGIDDSQLKSVETAGLALKYLAEASSKIPNEGGWAGKIFGENSLAAFGDQLPGFATDLNGFISNLGKFDKDARDKVKHAADAIVSLGDASKKLPGEDGWAQKIFGAKSLASFGASLPAFGTHMREFVTNLGTFTKDNVTTVGFAGDAINALADAADSIDGQADWAKKLFGDNSLATFGAQLPGFADNLSSFVGKLGTFTDKQVNAVKSVAVVLMAFADLGQAKVSGKDIKSVGKKLGDFGKGFKEFIDKMGEVSADKIFDTVSKTQTILNLVKNITSTDVESLKSFSKTLKSVATDGIKGFVDSFSSVGTKSDILNAMQILFAEVNKQAGNNSEGMVTKFTDIAKAAVTSMASDSVIAVAGQSGLALVQGFTMGINDNQYLATIAGRSLGTAALNAAKEALDENSPSKEAYKVGAFFGEGLVGGIKEYSSKVYNTSYDVAEYAKNGLSRAISSITNLITDDMDAQPTIRPVLDLSDIEAGAGYMNAMFANGPTVGVMANLNGISSNVRSKLQNGTNNDVVTAIDRLHKDIGNIGPTNNYNVNGVTYSDGDAAVSQAIETIVRAALMERRV